MPNRPRIPANVQREIFIESGHRCAVCGTAFPLERAHIIPWSKSEDHSAENLICLCANCHERADSDWDESTLRKYKQEPWVNRQHAPPSDYRAHAPLTDVTVTVELQLKDFDDRTKLWLTHAIADFLGTAPASISIRSIQKGSVKVTIALEKSDASRLIAAFEANDERLHGMLKPLLVKDISYANKERRIMGRSTQRDGLSNRLESFVLTRFAILWKLLQAIAPIRRWLNRFLIRRAIEKTKTRPHQFSLMADYTSWASLTDRTFTGRHLPPASDDYMDSLPPLDDVTELFARSNATYRHSEKSTVLFTNFAQWFTDGFLRTARENPDDPASKENYRRNTSNHEIDLCQIYGLHPAETAQLREFSGGRLKTSRIDGEEFPPLYFDDSGNPKDEEFSKVEPLIPDGLPDHLKKFLFVGGVERVNVQVGYAMLSTLFLREHNRIAAQLAGAYPTWDDERLFQTARNVLIVVLLRIVIEDYINHITPYHFQFRAEPWGFEKEKWYRNNWMTVEFNLLYRWHSMVPSTVLIDGQHRALRHSLFNNGLMIDRGLGAIFQDSAQQAAAEVGLLNTPGALLHTERGSLELGRKARLRSYNDYRELFSFPRVTDWSQITGNNEIQSKLQQVYRDVDQIELFVGLFAEDVRENSALSPLIGRMVGVDAFSQALTNPLLSIHVFNEQTFSKEGWQIIQQTSQLSQVLHRNLGSDTQRYNIKFTQDGDEIPAGKEDIHEEPAPPARSAASAETAASEARRVDRADSSPEESFDERKLYVK